VVVRDRIRGRIIRARPARLAAQGDVASNAVEKGAEASVPRRVEAFEGTAGA
jgi:hypothetical protein